jgi:hypothetical protein
VRLQQLRHLRLHNSTKVCKSQLSKVLLVAMHRHQVYVLMVALAAVSGERVQLL